MLYTDFEKAFDSVPHNKLMFKLKMYQVNPIFIDWVSNFLRDRMQRVLVNGHQSSWSQVLSGVPQGSVLGPLLFVIYINDLPEHLSHPSKLYADDNKIIARIFNENDVQVFRRDIQSLYSWSLNWGIYLNFKKCEVVDYGKGNPRNSYSFNLNADGDQFVIRSTDCVRDLGVILSENLKVSGQVNNCVGKANKMLGWITSSLRYLDCRMLKTIFKSSVRPHLEYAIPVWRPCFRKDIKLIENVQRRASRMVNELKKFEYDERLLN